MVERAEPWIALVGPEVEENLSLRYLVSALAAAGYRAEIHAFNSAADFPRIARALVEAPAPPLLIGLSLAFQWRAPDMLALALSLREGGYRGHLTSGGHFATFAAEDLLRDFPELDSICRLEADVTLVELARALEAGTALTLVAGLALREGDAVRLTAPRPLPALDGLPFPDRRGEPARCFGHAIMPLVGSRGCYGHCHFCSIAAWQEKGSPGRRFRLRSVEEIADEMAEQQRARGIEIFVFQDDNFFLPRPSASLARIHGLADALEARGVRRFATVVKARADDVRKEVFGPLVERLHVIRAYVGIESHSGSGLVTLGRNATLADNDTALDLCRELGLYICFNLLPFDPEATLESFQENVDFLERVADYPFCLSRVELYAGTPLLARLRAEGRARGDYLKWDYTLADPRLERLFRAFMACLAERNFSDEAAVVKLWLLRFDVEACRHFHPDRYRPEFLERAVAVTRLVSDDSIRALRTLVELSQRGDPPVRLVAEIARRAAAVDAEADRSIRALSADMSRAVGAPSSLTEVRHVLDAAPPAPVFL
jgi:radical SAM superfamily enzyme YgiQ (UPF0313 family)